MSCGSFFKNTSEFPSAGWLIDQAGCKGMKVGGAEVSEKHANFILNTGKATSSDILKLAIQVYTKVKEKFNVELEPEVQILPTNPFKK
jgi:UDP-N-acetylmuramate dehydrogenase